jgi:hypothetical protein
MSRPGGLQLSPVQIVASLLATLTGAILASYLGVGGTLAGAAVGSIASTTGTEVYRHYLRRSQERLKAAGEVLRHRQEPTGQHAARHAAGQPAGTARLGDAATETLATNQAGQRAARPGAAGPVAGRYNGRAPDTSADPTETQILPAAASAWQRRVGAEPAGPSASERATGELSDGRATGELNDGRATGELSDGAAPAGQGGGPWWRQISRRQWLTYGGVALGLFLVGMVVITIIELSVGKPLDAAVWGKPSTGTSVGNLVGGSGHKQPAPHTSSTPSSGSSGSTAPSSPAATPSGTSPTPSTSGSSSPSSGASATPTPGTGQGSAQAVTPTP